MDDDPIFATIEDAVKDALTRAQRLAKEAGHPVTCYITDRLGVTTSYEVGENGVMTVRTQGDA